MRSYRFICFCARLKETKSNHARLVQYRARKQAAVPSVSRLLTRAVLYRRPNVVWPDLRSPVIELRLRRLAVIGERAVFADRVGTLEDPILPCRQSSENFGVGCLRAGEAQ